MPVSWSFVWRGWPRARRRQSAVGQDDAPGREVGESRLSVQGSPPDADQAVVPTVTLSPGRMGGPAWSPARRARRSRLAEASRDLADLYEVAIDLVGNPDAPARMLLLGHCMREIGNRLPEILNPDLPGRSKLDKAVQSLVADWRAAGPRLSEVEQSDDPTPAISVPRKIAASLESVVAEFEYGETANYAKASFLVVGSVPDNLSVAAKNPDPAVSALVRTRRYFMGHTHAGVEDRQAPDEAELEEHVSHFEYVLDVRLGDWWEARVSIQDILARANARVAISAQADSADDPVSQGTGANDV